MQQAVGAALSGGVDYAGSPAALAEQQRRWEKESVERGVQAYRNQLAQAALVLLSGVNGHAWTPETALEAADKLFRGARGYSP